MPRVFERLSSLLIYIAWPSAHELAEPHPVGASRQVNGRERSFVLKHREATQTGDVKTKWPYFRSDTTLKDYDPDPEDEPQGISLSEWHEAADGYDDEYGDDGSLEDEGVSLTSYKFMKGAEIASQLDIRNPGTIMFVNAANEITYIHKGVLEDQDTIAEQWAIANWALFSRK